MNETSGTTDAYVRAQRAPGASASTGSMGHSTHSKRGESVTTAALEHTAQRTSCASSIKCTNI